MINFSLVFKEKKLFGIILEEGFCVAWWYFEDHAQTVGITVTFRVDATTTVRIAVLVMAVVLEWSLFVVFRKCLHFLIGNWHSIMRQILWVGLKTKLPPLWRMTSSWDISPWYNVALFDKGVGGLSERKIMSGLLNEMDPSIPKQHHRQQLHSHHHHHHHHHGHHHNHHHHCKGLARQSQCVGWWLEGRKLRQEGWFRELLIGIRLDHHHDSEDLDGEHDIAPTPNNFYLLNHRWWSRQVWLRKWRRQ